MVINAGNEVMRTLESLLAYPDCNQLATAANGAGDRIFEKYQQQDISYALTTRRGATQGAVSP